MVVTGTEAITPHAPHAASGLPGRRVRRYPWPVLTYSCDKGRVDIHPAWTTTEIKATLAGARARFPNRRIWAVWQPHTYSRTQTLFLDFARAFKDADEVIVTEVYAAREPKQDFTSAEIVSAMPHLSARYRQTLAEATKYLLDHLKPGDVVLTLSAGDADQISTDVLKGLQER